MALPVGEVKVRKRKEIGDPSRFRGVEKHLAVKSAHPPLVLIFDESGVRPFDDGGCQEVGAARLDEPGEIEFGREP